MGIVISKRRILVIVVIAIKAHTCYGLWGVLLYIIERIGASQFGTIGRCAICILWGMWYNMGMMKTWILDLPNGELKECYIHEPVRLVSGEYLETPDGPLHCAFIINPEKRDEIQQMLNELKSIRDAARDQEQKIINAMSRVRLWKPLV